MQRAHRKCQLCSQIFGLKIRAEYLSSLAGSELHRSVSSGQGCLAAGNKECRGFRIPTLLGASLFPPLTKNSPDLRIKGKKKNQCFFFELEREKTPNNSANITSNKGFMKRVVLCLSSFKWFLLPSPPASLP